MLFSTLSRGSFEGPVAGSDVTVVPQDNGTREDMEGVLLDPLVVVALVELVAVFLVDDSLAPAAGRLLG